MDKIDFIATEIRKFNPSITIDGSFGNADFAKLLEKYPKLLVYINGYVIEPAGGTLSRVFGGGSSKSNIIFKYKNKNISYESIFLCRDLASMENVLVYNLKNFNTRVAYIVPNQILMNSLINSVQHGNLAGQHPFFKGLQTIDGGALSTGLTYYLVEILYHVNTEELKEMNRKVDIEVARVANMLFEPTMPREVKVLLAHNYLCYIATYDPSYLTKEISFNPYSHSAYGALISKVCVCHGFSEAFKKLLNRVGVTCEIICGQVYGTSAAHAWNIVKIDEDYYHVDVTFDDRNEIMFDFFMKSDAEMRSNRKWNESYYPKCNGTKNIMLTVRSYINMNKTKLILKGIKLPVLKTL